MHFLEYAHQLTWCILVKPSTSATVKSGCTRTSPDAAIEAFWRIGINRRSW